MPQSDSFPFSRPFYYYSGERHDRNSTKLGLSKIHPAEIVETCLEEFYREHPNERTIDPMKSNLLQSISYRDLFGRYSTIEDAEAVASFFGFEFTDEVSCAVFIKKAYEFGAQYGSHS